MSVVNINVGILGHVDSGKTSLAKALSTTASTAAFDKNPQSVERGITLDLGFSSFRLPLDEATRERGGFPPDVQELQLTLVDCPGHASLFKTVIGGAQIIDVVLLVLDSQKGFQTQTAECLLLAEITCPGNLLVVLNKVDLLPPASAQADLDRLRKRVAKTLESTSFKDAQMLPISAAPGGPDSGAAPDVAQLLEALKASLRLPKRTTEGPFLMAVDHCFPIKGQGTVLTGTVLSGAAKVGDAVQLPSLGLESRKLKSIQVFRKSVGRVSAGERCGVCVAGLEAKALERGLVCSPGALPTLHAAIVDVRSIPYFKGDVTSKARFHISLGYETVMGRLSLFAGPADGGLEGDLDHVLSLHAWRESDAAKEGKVLLALLELDSPVLGPKDSLYIASRLDTDILHHAKTCRLAFHGRLLRAFTTADYRAKELPALRVFKPKSRSARVERALDSQTLIVAGLVKKETNVEKFAGLKVRLESGEEGVIEGGFGQSGKLRVRFSQGLSEDVIAKLPSGKKKKGPPGPDAAAPPQPLRVSLTFKRYLYDPAKQMIQ